MSRFPRQSRLGIIAVLLAIAAIGGAAAYPGALTAYQIRRMEGDIHEGANHRDKLIERLGPEKVERIFLRLLDDEHENTRVLAVQGLMDDRLVHAGTLAALERMLDDYDSRVREQIVDFARRQPIETSRELLLTALGDEDAVIRSSAARGLSNAVTREGDDDPATLAALARAVDDTDRSVVSSAVFALEKHSGRDFDYLARDPEDERRAAVQRLKQWWVAEKRQEPELPQPRSITRRRLATPFTLRDVWGETQTSAFNGITILHFFGTW